MTTLILAHSVLYPLATVWIIAVTFAQFLRPIVLAGSSTRQRKVVEALVRIHLRLWLIAGFGMLLYLTEAVMEHRPVGIIASLYLLYTWWITRNWPDDHFKRRRKKVADAVKVVGGRLVVKPAPA